MSAAVTLARGRPLRAGRRGPGHGRRWHPHGRADPARVPPRRLLGHPPAGRRLAVPVAAAARALRAALAPARAPARPPARRGAGRGAPPVGGRDRRRPRGGRQGLPALGGLDRRALGRPGPDGHRLAREGAPPPPGPHPLRAARADPGVAGRPDLVHDRRGPGPVRRVRGARLPPPRPPAHHLVRAGPPRRRARGGLAGRGGRLPGHRRRAGRPPRPSWAARSAPASRSPRWRSCRRHGPSCSTSRPRQVADLAGDRLSERYRARLRQFSPGPAAFKVDYALSGPVPWTNAACRRAGTVHVGGTADEVAAGEAAIGAGQAAGAALRPRRAAEPGRPQPRPGRAAHAVGLLPRAQRLDRST